MSKENKAKLLKETNKIMLKKTNGQKSRKLGLFDYEILQFPYSTLSSTQEQKEKHLLV